MTQLVYDAINVLIPTFNRRERLQRALESVIQETRIPLVVHIFDNASTDDTALYVAAMADVDPRIRYFGNTTNVGAMKNYEFAFESVRAKYFVPLADDDWLLPNFLYCAWNILQQHDDIGAAIFVTEQRSEAGELMTTYPAALDKIGWGRRVPKEHLRDLLTYGHYAWSSILWRSEVLSFLKGNYFCGGLASDVDFQVQIFCKYPVFLVNQSGAVYLAHDTQASRRYNVLSVPGWASLVRRMDRSIYELRVFEAEEYFKLRSVMLSRYRPTWRSTENVVLKTDQIIRIAALAGFLLEDWDFAYSLLASKLVANTSVSIEAVTNELNEIADFQLSNYLLAQVAAHARAKSQAQQCHEDEAKAWAAAAARATQDASEALSINRRLLSTLNEQHDRIAELRSESNRSQSTIQEQHATIAELQSENAYFHTLVNQCERDARRTRWLLGRLGGKIRHFPRDLSRRVRASLKKRPHLKVPPTRADDQDASLPPS